jgi:hypothetical protein
MLFCCTLSLFKPMHKGLMCFGFHYIVMFGTHDPSEALEFVFWFQLSHPSTFQFPSLIGVLFFWIVNS